MSHAEDRQQQSRQQNAAAQNNANQNVYYPNKQAAYEAVIPNAQYANPVHQPDNSNNSESDDLPF